MYMRDKTNKYVHEQNKQTQTTSLDKALTGTTLI